MKRMNGYEAGKEADLLLIGQHPNSISHSEPFCTRFHWATNFQWIFPMQDASFQPSLVKVSDVINLHVKHTGRWHICNLQS